MIIRCISKEPHGLGPDYGHEPNQLEIGKEYKVYGLETEEGNVLAYVSDQEDSFYPSKYLLENYFEIVSDKISRHWKLHFKSGGLCLFVEDWIRFPDFFRLYIDGCEPNPENYALFSSFYEVRNKIDSESENENQYLNSKKIINVLEKIPKVKSFDDFEHDEADTIVTALTRIRESCDRIFDEDIPMLLWSGQTIEQQESNLCNLGDELKYIQCHLNEMRYFRGQLNRDA
jgi:hypothetical protein